MFTELSELLPTAGMALTLNVVALSDGRLSITVQPKGEFKNPALGSGLSVQATPAELDAELVQQISRYVVARKSLSEQVDATLEVLAAAKTASQKEAGTAIAKASKASATPSTKPTQPTTKPTPVPNPVAVESEEIELF